MKYMTVTGMPRVQIHQEVLVANVIQAMMVMEEHVQV